MRGLYFGHPANVARTPVRLHHPTASHHPLAYARQVAHPHHTAGGSPPPCLDTAGAPSAWLSVSLVADHTLTPSGAPLLDKRSRQLIAPPRRLHKLLQPVAGHLQYVFGFQAFQLHKEDRTEVHSNLACQVDHLASLLSSRMQRYRHHTYHKAFQIAVGELHRRVFSNFTTWQQHLRLPTHPAHAYMHSMSRARLRSEVQFTSRA